MRKLANTLFERSRLQRLAQFRGDARGVAAIEFAMVVPLMILMFAGAVELSQAITVDRRISQVASATADLVARSKTLSTTEMTGIMEVAAVLVQPYDATPLKVTISNVKAAPADATNTTVCWSHNHNGGANTYSNGQAYALPAGVVEAGDSVIVAEVRYNYTAILFNNFGTSKMLSETFYLKPRLSSYVTFSGTGC